jgi:hypothetical protein
VCVWGVVCVCVSLLVCARVSLFVCVSAYQGLFARTCPLLHVQPASLTATGVFFTRAEHKVFQSLDELVEFHANPPKLTTLKCALLITGRPPPEMAAQMASPATARAAAPAVAPKVRFLETIHCLTKSSVVGTMLILCRRKAFTRGACRATQEHAHVSTLAIR